MNKILYLLTSLLLSMALIGATSCDDNLIYEPEGECPLPPAPVPPTPQVKFVFKKHRQALRQLEGHETDVFASTVGSVHLFVYDAESGELVFEKTETTDNLQSASELEIGTDTNPCYMDLDLAPGQYRLVAWCGLDSSDENNAFQLGTADSRSRFDHCRVKMEEEGKPVHSAPYDDLYHGVTRDVEIKADCFDQQIFTVELTKNTNDIHVWVQHTSQTFEKGDYEVVYTDANGTMHFDDNSMTSTDRLEYHPHASSLLSSDTEYNGSMVQTGALIAHLSTARLMAAHKDDARLEVRDREGKTVFSVPFIKYVLEMQTFVSENGSRSSSRDHQYYLDCEDTYNCTFYLTGEKEQDGAWMPSMIIINNWVKVPDQSENM